MAYVHNPDDEDDEFTFEGKVYLVPGHGVVEVPEHVADHAVAHLGAWGIVKLSKPPSRGKPAPQDAEAFEAAQRTYIAATKAWAEKVVVAAHRANAPRVAAGLAELPPTEALVKARKWLNEHPA